MRTYTGSYESPIGNLVITCTDAKLTSIVFGESLHNDEHTLLTKAKQQLEAYFSRKADSFSLPLHIQGTPFQELVWEALDQIPFGETVYYSELAKRTGNEKAVRAAAGAVGKNQFAIVVPCHRITGKQKRTTGYAWEPWRKEWLLAFEQKETGVK